MSNELNVDILVTNVLNTMSDELDDGQMIKLKNALYVNLHDVEVRKQTFDLSATIQNSDAKKVEYFAVAKKTIKRSESSIKQYISSA